MVRGKAQQRDADGLGQVVRRVCETGERPLRIQPGGVGKRESRDLPGFQHPQGVGGQITRAQLCLEHARAHDTGVGPTVQQPVEYPVVGHAGEVQRCQVFPRVHTGPAQGRLARQPAAQGILLHGKQALAPQVGERLEIVAIVEDQDGPAELANGLSFFLGDQGGQTGDAFFGLQAYVVPRVGQYEIDLAGRDGPVQFRIVQGADAELARIDLLAQVGGGGLPLDRGFFGIAKCQHADGVHAGTVTLFRCCGRGDGQADQQDQQTGQHERIAHRQEPTTRKGLAYTMERERAMEYRLAGKGDHAANRLAARSVGHATSSCRAGTCRSR